MGPTARQSEPCIEQLFIAAGEGLAGDAFERQLYLIRKRASHLLRGEPQMQAVGASGAVVGIVVLFALNYPNQTLLFMMIILVGEIE